MSWGILRFKKGIIYLNPNLTEHPILYLATLLLGEKSVEVGKISTSRVGCWENYPVGEQHGQGVGGGDLRAPSVMVRPTWEGSTLPS